MRERSQLKAERGRFLDSVDSSIRVEEYDSEMIIGISNQLDSI